MDSALPFGLRSAPKIFTAVADALQWVMLDVGVSAVDHYLDDLVTIGRPSSPECQQNLDRILAVCAELGVPLATDKLEGPSHCLTFLGIELDTHASPSGQAVAAQGPPAPMVVEELMSAT